jgi:hypothetical protein
MNAGRTTKCPDEKAQSESFVDMIQGDLRELRSGRVQQMSASRRAVDVAINVPQLFDRAGRGGMKFTST